MKCTTYSGAIVVLLLIIAAILDLTGEDNRADAFLIAASIWAVAHAVERGLRERRQ
jgi:hypothetical protein